MKIVHVIPALTKGGAERVVVDLANHAVKAGHEVTIVAAVPAPPELNADRLSPEVQLRYVGGRSIRDSYTALIPWLARNRAWLSEQDVVHSHLTFGSVFAAALLLMRRLRRQKMPAVVETYHAVGMAVPASARALHAALLRGRDAVAFMADDAYWLRYSQRRTDTLFRTIRNGIAAPTPATSEHLERYRNLETSLPPSAKAIVGSVGRLTPARRPDLLLEAFAKIASEMGPDVHLLLAGEGPERESLQLAAQRLGIAGQVHMPGLVLDPSEPIASMDLYLTVNVGPVTGIAGLEAAFLGVPVIACQLLSERRSTEDDWIWSSTVPREVGAHAAELLANRAKLRELSDSQQAHARAHYSVAAMARAYDELYSAALRRCGAAIKERSCP